VDEKTFGYGRESLERIKKRLHATGYGWVWDTNYQMDPPSTLAAEFAPVYFEGPDIRFDEWPADSDIAWRLVALDPSMGETEKSDYQAFICMAVTTHGIMYVDAVLDRIDASRMIDQGVALCRAFGAQIFGVEDVAFQKILQPMFIAKSRQTGFMIPVQGIPSRTEKIQRIRGQLTPYLAARNFRFKNGSPGVSLLLEQLSQFPNHKYKDGPDALAMAVTLAEHLFRFGHDALTMEEGVEVLRA
jgi:predicted phage terminase large subunit-like protein